ncbi:hypothetical protein NA57DRAFT_72700 [Rhizodiscina lignyota]|uniref:NadR/Ttd14 AAA domain-containing protein n=1 Tax=Rhizodiscina lignyota TaxID=1504668 RepID=A0A9P4IL39_9PEZI|nr:hypothetical protein NA57DRAFT_72700 [Rhizodiscina lignyota]
MGDPKNIFVIGAQCTGKSTLVNGLEGHFSQSLSLAPSPSIIREVARSVLHKYGFTRDDILNSPERALQLQEKILEAQFEAEGAILDDLTTKWYISDRSGLDPIVYAYLYVSEESAQRLLASPIWTALESNMKGGLVILCEAGCSWLVDDGTRLMPKDDKDWERVDLAFRMLLDMRDIEYILLPRDMKDLERRIEIVVEAHGSQVHGM